MLTEWKLANFKAIDEETDIELAPITVLAGANSSGKSSLLQSILLVAQTLRAKPGEQPLLLNGEYVRLGYIADILHDGNNHKPFVFGFGINLPGIENLPVDKHDKQDRPEKSSVKPNRITVKITSEDSTNEQSRVKLLSFALDSDPGRKPSFELVEVKDHLDLAMSSYATIQMPADIKDEVARGGYAFKVTSSYFSIKSIEPFRPQVSLRHFLPARILETYDAGTDLMKLALQATSNILKMTEEEKKRNALSIYKTTHLELKDSIGTYLLDNIRKALSTTSVMKRDRDTEATSEYNLAKSRAVGFLYHAISLPGWLEDVFKHINYSYRVRMAGELYLYLSKISPRETKSLRYDEIGARAINLPAEMRTLLDQVSDYFSNHIYYLGPLRESPQFIYGLPPYPEVTHVGLKGEFTASVLEHFKGTRVEYPLPIGKDSGEYQTDKAPLAYALQVWLEHMGLLENVTTTDRGKMGTELAVQAHGVNRPQDLTSIGVGVSQVLPTLVMGLIAPRGTTFLLEQPELHLHPRVQSILADFLLGLTWVGKQCIIETHSEYLINRLRRRVAEDHSNKLMDKINIYFVEREKGKSRFQKVDLNEFGAVINWPKGFFDEGPGEAQLIMTAAMEKRRQAKLDAERR